MGVATTLDAPRNMLPSNALRCLCPSQFTLGTPAERMDAIVEAVLVKPCSGFNIGDKVAVFMRNYFVSQDGTLTSFIKALKVDVDKLRPARIGDPRRRIQVDHLEFQKLLCCSCCTQGSSGLLPSMHDTSIMYKLAQEHGDLINLHDWYQSFKSIVLSPSYSKKEIKAIPITKEKKRHKRIRKPE
ncbi:hypothetical protein F3Y22_tig00110584pilonHSYRG00213 [Hibiscus syriacus]|uniref:Uncharacterized protein n=1 Tax=Hibiscus syriacus TaxID=106335 RepID=A0A6A3A7Z3_HIBSY|nr:hypothetical protein F3Y22_tig00110584pilonHSYRG00213 [Hibiscus syriacus]